MRKDINKKINKALKGCTETVWAYIKDSNSLGSNYDPYLNVGQVETFQSPIPVKALSVHHISNDGLIAKELGLGLIGAIDIVVNDIDKELIKNASKIKYNNQFYTTYHKALGSRALMIPRSFETTKFTLFIIGNS